MDVVCEKCRTEYVLDDARIPSAGVAVKCSSCAHVFRVSKPGPSKAVPAAAPLGMPGPSAPPEATLAAPPPAVAPLEPVSVPQAPSIPPATPAPEAREWKVRQPNGNIFTCRELTTLQRWIVERKVTRDDEISLTGESWKRLGDIAELASFFQVVDEATKAHQAPAPVAPSPAPAPPPRAAPPAVVPPSHLSQEPALGPSLGEFDRPLRTDSMFVADLGEDFKPRRSLTGPFIVTLLALTIAGAAAYYGYQAWKGGEAPDPALAAELDAGTGPAEETAPAVADEDAGPGEAVAEAPLDAGPAPAEPAAVAPPAAPEPAEPAAPPELDFDALMAQADRLRESGRTEAAIKAYEGASEVAPQRAEPIAGMGLALFDQGSLQDAEAAFERALALNDRYAVAIMGLAETYRALGKSEAAAKQYRRYLDVLPNGSEAGVARRALDALESE